MTQDEETAEGLNGCFASVFSGKTSRSLCPSPSSWKTEMGDGVKSL